jgi:hypothetical protein
VFSFGLDQLQIFELAVEKHDLLAKLGIFRGDFGIFTRRGFSGGQFFAAVLRAEHGRDHADGLDDGIKKKFFLPLGAAGDGWGDNQRPQQPHQHHRDEELIESSLRHPCLSNQQASS